MDQLQLKAYSIFVEELQNHLLLAKEALSHNLKLEPAFQQRLGVAFHNIKGGAGFFRLEKLQDCAKRLERLVRDTPTQGLPALFETYSTSLSELELYISQMPKPTASQT